jgi:hypothetical protein
MRVGKRMVGLVAAVGLLVCGGVAAADGGPWQKDAEEAKWRESLRELAPSAVADWDWANAARESDRQGATYAFARVYAAAPTFVHALRRQCSTEPIRSVAIDLCHDAIRQDPRWENRFALALRLFQGEKTQVSEHDVQEAFAALKAARESAPDEPTILILEAMAAFERQDEAPLRANYAHLKALRPDDPATHYLGAFHALIDNDPTEARAELAAFEKSGKSIPEFREFINKFAYLEETEWTPLRIGKWFFGGILGWLAVLAALLVAGELLSKATLHATERFDPKDGGNAVGGAAIVKRLYATVMTLSGAVYFLSLPWIGLLVTALVAGLIYGCFAVGTIPIKLLFIVLAMGATTLFALAKAVYYSFVTPTSEDPGIVLTRTAQPRVHALLAEVAERCGTRPVDRLILTQGTDFGVFEQGGFLETSRGRGVRCLVVGVGLLRGVGPEDETRIALRLGPLKAILAHEYGHFKNEDTAGGAFSFATLRSMTTLLQQLVTHGAASAFNPAWHFALQYFKLYLRISHGATRLQEVLADRWAVVAYGSENFVAGLETTIRAATRFNAITDRVIHKAIHEKAIVPNLYAFADDGTALGADVNAVLAASDHTFEARLAEPASAYDSHPRPADRIARARALAIPHDADDTPAWSLFEHPEELERALTARIAHAVFDNHGVVLRTATTT